MGLLQVNTQVKEEIAAQREESRTKRAEKKAEKAKKQTKKERKLEGLGTKFSEDKFLIIENFLSHQIESGHADRVKELCFAMTEEVKVWEEEQAKKASLPEPIRVFVNKETGAILRNSQWEDKGQPEGFSPRIRWQFPDGNISVFDVSEEVAAAFNFGEYDPEGFEEEIEDALSRFSEE